MSPTVTDLLADMVRIPTVNDRDDGGRDPERPLREMMANRAASAGFDTQSMAAPESGENLLVRFEARPGAPWVVFESHLDTVTAEGMAIDPFAGEIRDGRLWGRGACDTKGTGAAMFEAMRRYATEPGDRPNNIMIAFTADEEVGMTGAAALARDWPKLQLEPLVGVIVGEPTELQMVVAHNGVARYRLTTRGVAAHSSAPAQGHCAITDMVTLHQAVRDRYITQLHASDPLTGAAQCSINRITGGRQINVIPDHCEADLDRRVVPGESIHDIAPALQAILDDLAATDERFDATVHTRFTSPPLTQRYNRALQQHVQRALATCDLPNDPTGVGYGTDAGPLDNAALPAVVLGPGNIAQAHTHDEFIELDQLHRGVEVYHAIMTLPV